MPGGAAASDMASLVSAAFRAVARDMSSCVKEGWAGVASRLPELLLFRCVFFAATSGVLLARARPHLWQLWRRSMLL